MIEIKSSSNSTLKKLRSVKSKKYRDELELYLIEGKKTVLEAFNCGEPVCYLVLCNRDEELLIKAKNSHTEVILTTYDILKTLSDTKNPPDCLAYITIEKQKVDMRCGVTVAMDCVCDPYNAGTIIRTADALGAKGVLADERGCSIYSPKVQRAAMGSMFHIPAEETDIFVRLRSFKDKGGFVMTTALDGEEKLPELPESLCLVVGNEGAGVCEAIKEISDCVYKIPMRGRAESLNVGVACGIILFELLNGR